MSAVVTEWREVLSALHGARERFLSALDRVSGVQQAQLDAALVPNRDTAFGKQHSFARIQTAKDYQNSVAPQTYEDLATLIQRTADGESGLLTAHEVVAFERTGGSFAGPKLIPYTAAGLDAIARGAHAWLDDLFQHRPRILTGRTYWSISPAARAPETTAGGIPVGLPDAAYLGARLGTAIAPLLLVPETATSIEEWRRATLAAFRDEPAITLISIWSPTFLLELLRDLPDPAALFPHIDTISCWTSGASAPFSRRLSELFPQAFLQGKGLLATEGIVTIPLAGAPYPVLAVESGFYEFLDDAGQPHLAHELQPDATYEVLLTTHSGLYRYRLGDRVAMRGYYRRAPMLEFLTRANSCSDLCGEKLTEAFVLPLLAGIPGFHLLTPCTQPHPAYVLYLDSAEHDETSANLCAAALDGALRMNPQYDYARQLGQLDPVVPVRVPHALQRYHEMACAPGRRLGDVKPPGFSHEHFPLSVFAGH
jgi:hypothetical protein